MAVTLIAGTTQHTVADLGTFAGRNLIGRLAFFLQFLVPAALLIGGLIGFVARMQGKTLYEQMRAASVGPELHNPVRSLSWRQFEQLIGEAFRRRGFQVINSGGSAPDGGIDVELAKAGKVYLVQCKHWRVRQVGVSVVRELNGVIAARKATGGYVVTSGIFTREAWQFAQSCSIELIDGEKLASMIREVERQRASDGLPAASRQASHPPAVSAQKIAACPRCGAEMVRRVAKQGVHAGEEFWGCSRYPGCRGTRVVTAR